MQGRSRAVVAMLAAGLLGWALGAAAAQRDSPSKAPEKPVPAETVVPSGQVPNEVVVNRTTVGRRVPPRPGDVCLACNNLIGDDDVVFLVRGQRVPVHLAEMDPDVRAQLVQLLAQLEPRGAFLGAQQEQPELSPFWFFAGFYVLLGLIFGALCAHRALHAGRSQLAWFGIGLALNAVGYLLLLSRRKREVLAPAGIPRGLKKISATYQPEPCGGCGALNHPSATACLGCGAALEPKMVSEVARAGLRPV